MKITYIQYLYIMTNLKSNQLNTKQSSNSARNFIVNHRNFVEEKAANFALYYFHSLIWNQMCT